MPGFSIVNFATCSSLENNCYYLLISSATIVLNQILHVMLYILCCVGIVCPGNDCAIFPDVHNCAYFYQCVGTMVYHMPCAPGLYFNAAIRRCDYASNVYCPNTSTPPTGRSTIAAVFIKPSLLL